MEPTWQHASEFCTFIATAVAPVATPDTAFALQWAAAVRMKILPGMTLIATAVVVAAAVAQPERTNNMPHCRLCRRIAWQYARLIGARYLLLLLQLLISLLLLLLLLLSSLVCLLLFTHCRCCYCRCCC